MTDLQAMLSRVEQLVQERTGIAPSRVHEASREHTLRLAMAREGVADVHAFHELITRDPRAFDALISDWTVPESYFFREPSHFEFLRSQVLPELLAGRRPDHRMAFWSAGCAAGEEACSLAIMLEEAGVRGHARVLGTDVSRAAIARANNALYSRWALRVTSAREVAAYFEREGASYRLIRRLRERVRFVQHNLASTLYPGVVGGASGFDLVLCRNVLIYFGAQTVREVGQRLARSLAPGGYLLLGPSDPALALDDLCDVVSTPSGLLYRRRVGAAPLRVRAQPSTPSVTSVPVERSPVSAAVAAPPVATAPTEPSARSVAQSLQLVRRIAEDSGSRAGETACRDELAAHPLSAELHALRAELLIDLGLDEGAEQAVRRALYLDRTLPLAQLLSAALAERRGDRAAAQRSYAQLAEACRGKPAEDTIGSAEGLTFAELAAIAAARATALERRGTP